MATAALETQFRRLRGSLPNGVELALPSVLAVGISMGILFRMYRNYWAWRSAGVSGLPSNILGWTLQWIIRAFSRRDTQNIALYSKPAIVEAYGAEGKKRFLDGDLPYRTGTRPDILPWIIPQRQAGHGNDPDVRKLESDMIKKIASDNSDFLVLKKSQLENHGLALFLGPDVPLQSWDRYAKGEIAHIHLEAEGSSHVTVSISDAKEIMEKGWGQRHGLSGRVLAWGYVMIYAPRNKDEVEILGKIFRAGIRFMSGGKEAR